MEGLDTHISSMKSWFQQAPKAFQIVCVNIAIHVLDGVVYHGMAIIYVESLVGLQFIAENRTPASTCSRTCF